jgi:hypothetical protein
LRKRPNSCVASREQSIRGSIMPASTCAENWPGAINPRIQALKSDKRKERKRKKS